jgi:Endonuclease/Exonuclease/phosphatase family
MLYGFHERVGNSFVFHPERADATREVVHAEAPDVLGLTEAVFCGPRGRHLLQDFATMFELPHVFFGGDEGDWTSCLVAGEHGRWHFDLVHPSPHIEEAARVEAFHPLFAPTPEPRVVFGDFNALSDEDPYTHEVLVADMRANVADPAPIATTMLDRQLLAAMRGAGFCDTMPVASRTHTIPSRLVRPTTQGARLRIDYVLVSEGVESNNAKVIQTEAADRASDHYPIVVELSQP